MNAVETWHERELRKVHDVLSGDSQETTLGAAERVVDERKDAIQMIAYFASVLDVLSRNPDPELAKRSSREAIEYIAKSKGERS